MGLRLPVVGRSLDVVSLLDLQRSLKEVINHHKVYLPIGLLVFEFVEPVDVQEEGPRVVPDILSIVSQQFPQFLVLFFEDGSHNQFGVLGVVEETPTLSFRCLVGQTCQVAHQQVAYQILQSDTLQEVMILNLEVAPDVEEHFRRIVHEYL